MDYKCTYGFEASGGTKYSYGTKITSSEYDQLTSSEKRHFKSADEDSFFGYGKPGSIAMGDMLGTGLPGGLDGDMSTLL